LNSWKRVIHEVKADVSAARARDPAAQGVSTFEILTSWAGVQALLAHRVAHELAEAGVPLLPRLFAYLTRAVTGVEIHPAAKIGREFFIDHGSGVVIGETAEIGERVTLYQGVTLGGTGFQRGKRHPTLGDAQAPHQRRRIFAKIFGDLDGGNGFGKDGIGAFLDDPCQERLLPDRDTAQERRLDRDPGTSSRAASRPAPGSSSARP